MENQHLFLGLCLFGLVIVLGCLYYYFKKIRQVELFNRELQKHVLLQRQVLEQHDKILRSEVPNVQPQQVQNTAPSVSTLPPLVQPQESVEQQENFVEPNQQPVQNIASPMQKVIPLVSTLMGNIFQSDGNSIEDDLNDIVKEKMEEKRQIENEELKKKELENEIEKELNELNSEIESEGRIDEEEQVKDIDLESRSVQVEATS